MPLFDQLLSVIAPHSCVVCSTEGTLLCAWCAPDAFPRLPSRCYKCLNITQDNATCAACRRKTPLKHVWVATNYNGAAKELLRKYKFERVQAAAAVISQSMADIVPFLSADTVIVPIPTATVRIRQRGYDHATLLARSVAITHNLNWSRAVTRLTQSRQVGASRELRLKQLENAFSVVRPSQIKGARILLIDDVVTTGATLESVAKVLKNAGAKTIDAVVFAQKQ